MGDALTGLVLTLFGLVTVGLAQALPGNPRIELRPGLYPLFLGALLVFFGLILLWQGRSALRKGAATVQFPQEVLRPSMLFLAMIAYRAALPYLGFVISTLVFLFTIVLFFDGTRLQAALCTTTVLSFLYVIFKIAFKVPLPRGFFG